MVTYCVTKIIPNLRASEITKNFNQSFRLKLALGDEKGEKGECKNTYQNKKGNKAKVNVY